MSATAFIASKQQRYTDNNNNEENMNQRVPTSNNAKDKTDIFSEAASEPEKTDQIGDNHIKHAPASASQVNSSYEEYRAEIFGNKLRAARNR